MKLRQLSLAVFAALLVASAGPAVLRADTIYYRPDNVPGILSTSGTIVRETDDLLEIKTADGQTVSIARDDVVQMIRDAPSAEGGQDPTGIPIDILEKFPGASALARGETFDVTRSRSAVVYHYGLKVGMNISNVRADAQELEDGDALRSYAFGFWWEAPVWRRLNIRAETLYSMKGDSESAGGYTASTHLGYLEVPILAKIGFLHNAPVQPSLFVGPSLGINLSAKSKLEGENSDVEVDVKDQVSGFDLGLVVGGGLDFELGRGAFGVDLRYSRGLSDVGDGATASARNEVFTVMGSIGLR